MNRNALKWASYTHYQISIIRLFKTIQREIITSETQNKTRIKPPIYSVPALLGWRGSWRLRSCCINTERQERFGKNSRYPFETPYSLPGENINPIGNTCATTVDQRRGKTHPLTERYQVKYKIANNPWFWFMLKPNPLAWSVTLLFLLRVVRMKPATSSDRRRLAALRVVRVQLPK